MPSSETAKLIAELGFKDKLTPGVGTALKSVDRLDKGLGRAGKGVGQLGLGLGRVVAVGAGAAVVALGGATKAAIDFEDAFAGVRKTVDAADLTKAGLSFDKLKDQFLDLSTVIPVTASDLARIGETAGALGIRAQDITKFADTVAKLGVTTNLTTDEAANSLGKIGTILGLTGGQFEDFGDILVNLGNKGASTEAEIIEITKRFAAAGKSAGLSTPQILAFASAISSAGVEPEAAGGALSRLFGKLVQQTALGTAKAKAFAKTSGKSFKDFSKIVEDDTNGAMLLFIKSLSKLSKFDQAKALKSVGITNTRDINAIQLLAQTYEKNLIPALKNAEESAGALDKEAGIRFDTIKSKFQLLKNAFVKGGIEMGEGFLPALGRLTTKVTAWVNTNSGKLQQVGRDIGKALDDIDWKEVERGAGKVADAAKVIVDVVKQIPTEVKLGGLAFIGLDKASGGLLGKGLGNVAGGVGGAVLQQFLQRGSSPANPLWVQSIGGVGGGPGDLLGGAGKTGILATIIKLVPLAALAVGGALAVEEGVKGVNTATGSNFIGLSAPAWASFPINIANAIILGIKTLKPGLFTPKSDDRGLDSPTTHPKPGVTHTPTSREARAGMPEVRQWHFDQDKKVTLAVENLRRDIGPSLSQTPTKVDAVKGVVTSSGIAAALASKNAGNRAYSGALTGAAAITAAIRANRPIINVDSRTIIDSRTYNSSINRETTYINGGYNGGAPQGGR